MSKLGAYAEAILLGGLPAALDVGKTAGTSLSDKRPEKTPPSPKVEDRDTSQPPPRDTSILDHMSAKQWVIAGVGLAVVGVLMFYALRGAARAR